MVLVRRVALLTALFLSVTSVVFVGVHGYRIIQAEPADPVQAKLQSESLLFTAVVAAGVVLVAGLWTLLRGLDVTSRLDRLVNLERYGNVSIQQGLARLGPLGDQIRRLHHHVNELNEKQALKISALAGVADFLMRNTERPMLVVDPTGAITSASRGAQGREGELLNRSFDEVLQTESFTTVVSRLEHSRNLIPDRQGKAQYLPVFNRDGVLASVIVILDQQEVHVEGRRTQASQAGRMRRRTLRHWVGRGRQTDRTQEPRSRG